MFGCGVAVEGDDVVNMADGHDEHEEDHDERVGGGEHIVHVLAGVDRGVGVDLRPK